MAEEGSAQGHVGVAMSNMVVGELAKATGRGPTQAKTTLSADAIFVVLQDTLTAGERSLVRAGESETVLDLRRRWQGVIRDSCSRSVEQLTGRKVIGFLSDNQIDPDMAVETFVVFHDCAHGSLFLSKRANRWVGRLAGLLVLSPFERWRHDHAVHHGSSGDLERRGVGDIVTLTIDEYRLRSWRGRLGYRVIRNPLFMFGLGPIVAMVVGPRIATRAQRPRLRHSVLATDAVILSLFAGLCWVVGWERLLLVWAPPALLAGSVGIWLFYVQHQFEDAYWQRGTDWDYTEAALRGSSYLKLPMVLEF